MKNCVFRSVLENAKYEWSLTHCTSEGTKTNAPFPFILDVFRQYMIQNNVTSKSTKNVMAQKLLSAASAKTDKIINFTLNKKRHKNAKQKKNLVTKLTNPKKNLGGPLGKKLDKKKTENTQKNSNNNQKKEKSNRTRP
eukprot:TRINITY_DN18878_c0_g1_i1.p1 TRINITY_DN18878_c0_g1~~TRINITY_DN18878_c0_g1_i1.p1  ORF type:complete len:138 (+),score=0.52 TRINITY_DN18878_c0_g1_i1:89-502(+)